MPDSRGTGLSRWTHVTPVGPVAIIRPLRQRDREVRAREVAVDDRRRRRHREREDFLVGDRGELRARRPATPARGPCRRRSPRAGSVAACDRSASGAARRRARSTGRRATARPRRPARRAGSCSARRPRGRASTARCCGSIQYAIGPATSSFATAVGVCEIAVRRPTRRRRTSRGCRETARPCARRRRTAPATGACASNSTRDRVLAREVVDPDDAVVAGGERALAIAAELERRACAATPATRTRRRSRAPRRRSSRASRQRGVVDERLDQRDRRASGRSSTSRARSRS